MAWEVPSSWSLQTAIILKLGCDVTSGQSCDRCCLLSESTEKQHVQQPWRAVRNAQTSSWLEDSEEILSVKVMHQIRLNWSSTAENKKWLWTSVALYKAETILIWKYLEGEGKWTWTEEWWPQKLASNAEVAPPVQLGLELLWTRDSRGPLFPPPFK